MQFKSEFISPHLPGVNDQKHDISQVRYCPRPDSNTSQNYYYWIVESKHH